MLWRYLLWSRVSQPPLCSPKTGNRWRPVIDSSSLNTCLCLTAFKMETPSSVLQDVKKGRLDVLHRPQRRFPLSANTPWSREFLHFVWDNKVYQLKVLCFGLATALQVSPRVLGPVSKILDARSLSILGYRDNWLLLASSHRECLQAREGHFALCIFLVIVITLVKSSLIPSQTGPLSRRQYP